MFGGGGGKNSGGGGLTLNLLPQSVLEGAFALALVIVLAVPLIARIHRLLEEISTSDAEPSRSEMGGAKVETADVSNRYSVDHSVNLLHLEPGLSSSSMRLDLSGLDYDRIDDINSERRSSTARTEFEDEKFDEKNIDKNGLDYRSYRHKLVEEVLKKYYDKQQPPGNVVMNSIHLNSQDELRIHPQQLDFFNFVDEYYDYAEAERRKKTQYLHPLDHFLVKGEVRPITEDRSVETKTPSLWSIPESLISRKSGKNEGETPTGTQPQWNRMESDLRYETCNRPKTAGSKSPSFIREPKNDSQTKPFYRPSGNSSQPAEVLRIEREEIIRPMTAGESSSDICSSVYDSPYDSGRQSPSPHSKTEKDTKRPWLTSSRPDSFNRKYGKLGRDIFNELWRSRPKHRDVSPPASARNDSTISISGKNCQRSTSPKRPKTPTSSPTRHQNKSHNLQKTSEVLQNVTTLSSSLDESPHSRMTREECYSPPKRSLIDSGYKDLQGSNESTSQSTVCITSSTCRRKVSRLPLHINSKKPIGSSSMNSPKSQSIHNPSEQSMSEDKHQYDKMFTDDEKRKPRTQADSQRADLYSRHRSLSPPMTIRNLNHSNSSNYNNNSKSKYYMNLSNYSMSDAKCQPNQTCTRLSKLHVKPRPKTSIGIYSLKSSLRKSDTERSDVINVPENGFEKKKKEKQIEESRENLRTNAEEGAAPLRSKISGRKRKPRIEADTVSRCSRPRSLSPLNNVNNHSCSITSNYNNSLKFQYNMNRSNHSISEEKCRIKQSFTKVKGYVRQRPKTTTGVYGLMPSLRKRKLGTTNSLQEKELGNKKREKLIKKSKDNIKKDVEEGGSPWSWAVKMYNKKRKQRQSESVEKFHKDDNQYLDLYHRPASLSTPINASNLDHTNSRVQVTVNRSLKSYFEKLKIVMGEPHGNSFKSTELASLCLRQAVSSDLVTHLNANDIRKLRDILHLAERKLALDNRKAIQQ